MSRSAVRYRPSTSPMARHSQPMRLPGRRAKTTAPTVAKAKKGTQNATPTIKLTGGEPVVGQQEPNQEPLAQDDQRPQAPGEPGCRARTEAVASRPLHDTAPHRATLAPCRVLLCDDVAALPPPVPMLRSCHCRRVKIEDMSRWHSVLFAWLVQPRYRGMDLPVMPPVAPMLARSVGSLGHSGS